MPKSGTRSRGKVIDLKKKAEKRAETRWAAPPRVQSSTRTASKPQRLRNRRRKQRALMFSICMLVGAGLVGGLGVASHAERFAIKDVQVQGAEQLSANALTAAVQSGLADNFWKIFAKKNMFIYPAGDIEESLVSEFPRIKEVDVSRPSLLAQAVVVTINEREPYAKWCSTTCYLLDVSGFIFAENSDKLTPATTYVFRGGLIPGMSPIEQTFLRGRLADITHFLQLLRDAGFTPTGITVQNEKDFAVPLEGGPRLMVPFDVEGERIVRDFQIALEADSVRDRVSELEYVDLRFGNRVYYKFKGEAAPQEEEAQQEEQTE